jgi:hypothetical protein
MRMNVVLPEEAVDLAAAHRQVDVVDDGFVAELFRHAGDVDREVRRTHAII